MRRVHTSPAFQHLYSASVEIARKELRRFCQLEDSTDIQLIRTALNQLPMDGVISGYHHLVMLRWVTILLENLPPGQPERPELYRAWLQAKERAREII